MIITAIIFGVALAGLFLLWAMRKRRRKATGYFEAEREALAMAESFDNVELVVLLTTEIAASWIVKAILSRRGEMLPAILAAMKVPKVERPYTDQEMDALDLYRGGTPLEVLLECLRQIDDPACIPDVVPLTQHPNEQVRASAARVLASLAPDDAAESLCRLLAKGGDVRLAVLRGITHAVSKNRGGPAFRARLFEAVTPLVASSATGRVRDAAVCLIAIDSRKALEVLTADDIFSMSNPHLHDILSAIKYAGESVPLLHLLRLCSFSPDEPHESANHNAISTALHLLSSHDTPDSRNIIERMLASPVPSFRQSAMAALLRLEGLDAPWDVAGEKADSLGIEHVSIPVRNALRCRVLLDQICNGGFSQWFANGFGRHWEETQTALTAVGAAKARVLVEQALALFGPSGPPSADYDDAVARAHQANDKPWRTHDNEWHSIANDVEVQVMRYMLDNRSHFTCEKTI